MHNDTLDDSTSLRFDGCLATNLEQAYRHLEQLYERLIAPLDLTVLEWYALRALYDEEGMMASRLATLVCRHPSSMTAMLDRMEAKGLLLRRIDPSDRRSVRISLTARGRSCEARVRSIADQITRLLADAVTPEQMASFLHVLGVLQDLDLAGLD
jgi:DNA-binding MarR family transcriptional regulator